MNCGARIFFLSLLACLLTVSFCAPPPGVRVSMAHNNSAQFPYSHNSNFVVTPSGRLAVVYQASSQHEGATDMSIFIVFSSDAGLTWTAPARLAGNGSRAEWGPVLAADAERGLLHLFYAESGDPPTSLCGDIYGQVSRDDGSSWEPRTMVLPTSSWGGCAKCPDNQVVRQPSGGWALPFFSAQLSGQTGRVGAGLVASPAGGSGPWSLLNGSVTLPTNASYYYEPAVAQCGPSPSTRLLMLLRSQVGILFASTSDNGGGVWGAPTGTGLPNPNSKVNLATWTGGATAGGSGGGGGDGGLAPGDLLLAYNPTNCSSSWCPRSPMGVSVSQDCGSSWSPPLLIEPKDGGKTFSYPTIDRCGPDTLCMVYTYLVPDSEGGVNASGIRFLSFPTAMLGVGAAAAAPAAA